MKESYREDLALFRYDKIQPMISGDFPDHNQEAYLARVAGEQYLFPDGQMRPIQRGTLKMWLHYYRKEGFQGLKPKPRADRGSFTSLNLDHMQEIQRLIQENPRRTAAGIHRKLTQTGVYREKAPSLTSVQRFIAGYRKEHAHLLTPIEDMKAFEMPHINDLWQIDTTHGPYLTLDGRKRKVYIIAIIDDASRLLVGYGTYFEDNALNVQDTLRRAILTYGLPNYLYADNGAPYIDKQLKLIGARLGFAVRHTKPYRGNQKGKIERWFGVMKQQWMHELDSETLSSLEDFQAAFSAYVVDRNTQVNRSLGKQQTPLNRFMSEPEYIRKRSAAEVDQAFLHQETRQVAKDGTISFKQVQYETGQSTIGQRVMIHYMPDLSHVYLVTAHGLTEIHPVNKVENRLIRRQQVRLNPERGADESWTI